VQYAHRKLPVATVEEVGWYTKTGSSPIIGVWDRERIFFERSITRC
jgi:hypothetical protein